MNESRAKRRLRRLLRSYTAGTILHLLADVFREAGKQARATNNPHTFRKCRRVAQALFVVGLGIDAAYPR
jgi:hypothetical protein